MNVLKRLLIKDYKSTDKPEVRVRYGLVAGLIGLISNLLLFAAKLIVGIISNSITIIADAINNISDAGSSIVTMIGFKLSSRPADSEHPYGHARYEYITALMVAILVLVIGVLLGKESIEKIISPETVVVDTLTFVVLGVAIVGKFAQMLVYRNFGKAVSSDALLASGQDSRNDIISTTAVLAATIFVLLTGINIDGYMGLAVSLFIVISALKLIKDTISPILGEKPDVELIKKIKEKLLSYDGVLGIHDLMVHSYGQGNCFAIVHVEVSAAEDIMVSHDLMDNIERDFQSELNIHLNIHTDPIDTDDLEVITLRERTAELIISVYPKLSLHDFRLVRGTTHTNILFDVVIPYGETVTLQDIRELCEKEFSKDEMTYYLVINVDRDFV